MKGEPRLEAKGVRLSKGGTLVLGGIDVAFDAGSVTAIVGPSGSGKTTLLRCFNRLEEPDEGHIYLDGKDITTIDPVALRRSVGMIFQTPVLFEGGVRGNLIYGLGEVDDDVLADALEAAGLERRFLDRASSALSVGQAQRVTIARALVRGPQVLLMDEPTSALDRDAENGIEGLIRDLAGRGLCIVLVTHDLEQAARVADCAFLLHGGRLRGSGRTDELEALWSREVRE